MANNVHERKWLPKLVSSKEPEGFKKEAGRARSNYSLEITS